MNIVVNWFQNFVSLWSETVSLSNKYSLVSCELVSKFCIFVIWNSLPISWTQRTTLWIGFKILYLCDLKQSIIGNINGGSVVNWFQNFVSLWSETVFRYFVLSVYSCELVSKFCIFVIWNSATVDRFCQRKVVNWFQNFVSLWSETVLILKTNVQLKLWIGFKILYLCDLKQ